MRTKRTLGLLFIALSLAVGAVSFLASSGSGAAIPPQAGDPERLMIPSLGIEAEVEVVGTDREGRMAVPKDPLKVAWFSLGPRPGERGHAVIAGHLTRRDLTPAVFADLGSLQAGDEIRIVSGSETRTFRVRETRTFPFDAEPPPEVFGPSDEVRLNLITCAGEWDQGERSFTQRLVVFASLVP